MFASIEERTKKRREYVGVQKWRSLLSGQSMAEWIIRRSGVVPASVALRAHTLVLEDGPELPDSFPPA
jgi:hypothetical protein